jgi:hypothetical protein
MGQDEYLEDLADKEDGEPHARLADPRAERTDDMELLREIGREIGDPALQRRIESGEATFDDPQIDAFLKGQEAEYEKSSDAIAALEKEIGEDFARLANETKRQMARLYESLLAAKEKLAGEKDRLSGMVEKGIKTLSPYQKQVRLAEAGYDQAYKAFNDYVDAFGISAEVRESLARREARAEERARQKGLNKRRRALQAFREIRKALIKRIFRKASYKTINHDQWVMIKTLQRLFEPSLSAVNKWIGSVKGPLLQAVWSEWQTDEEYRQKLMNMAGKGKAGKIEAILKKEWDSITAAEKKTLHSLLPKSDFVREFALEKVIKEIKADVQLDITERLVDGKVVGYILGGELEQQVREAVGDDLYYRIQNKSLEEWSLKEGIELARIIDGLFVEGRKELRAKEEARRIIDQKNRNDVMKAILSIPRLADKPDDTPEEKARKEEKRQKILLRYSEGKRRNRLWNSFFDADLRHFTTALDGGRKGIFTDLLYWRENDAYNKREHQIAARRLAVEDVMKKNKISLDELYKEVTVPGFDELYAGEAKRIGLTKELRPDLYRVSQGSLTVDDLLYILRGYRNNETYKAIVYGNLSSADERDHYKKGAEKIEKEKKGDDRKKALDDLLGGWDSLIQGRMMAVVSFAKDYFAKEENKKFLALSEAIGEDYDRNGVRLNKAMIEMFNKPMWRVKDYVPMNRREQSGAEKENRVIEDLLGITGAGQKWVSKGWSEKRIKIAPYNQTPIELGLYKTWQQSVKDTEHFIAYAPLVRNLNAVFKGYDTGPIKQGIEDRWGAAVSKRIDDTIARFANPNAGKLQMTKTDEMIRNLRGKTATAYLAWKVSGVLKQAVTSPWPYLQEIPPPQYLRALFEVAGGAGKINDFIKEKSIYMKNREWDPMAKLVAEQMKKNKNAIGHKIDQFNAFGMKGLEWIDWACVAPGWLAKYRIEQANIAAEEKAKYQELLEEYHGSKWSDVLPTEESKVNMALSELMTEEQRDYEAVKRADDVVRRTQPGNRDVDKAPMFESRGEIAKAFFQFQFALNRIWQNMRYDLPLAVREKQVLTVVGMVTGYAAAGICLGLLLDDDDEKEKNERNAALWILYNSLTQFTDAVPIIGEGVTAFAETFITGKRLYRQNTNILPVVEKAFGGLGNAAGMLWEEDPKKRKQKFMKAAGNMAEAFGIRFGLPVSGIKGFGRAFGIGDGDGEPDINLQALFGRR